MKLNQSNILTNTLLFDGLRQKDFTKDRVIPDPNIDMLLKLDEGSDPHKEINPEQFQQLAAELLDKSKNPNLMNETLGIGKANVKGKQPE